MCVVPDLVHGFPAKKSSDGATDAVSTAVGDTVLSSGRSVVDRSLGQLAAVFSQSQSVGCECST